MDVRLAERGDIGRVTALHNWAIERTWASFHTAPLDENDVAREWEATRELHPWLVVTDGAEEDSKGEFVGGVGGVGVVGYAKSGAWGKRCAYAWSVEVSVYVDEAHHGRGVGRALYARLFELLRAQGYRSAIGGIALPNKASVRLHESLGMERVALFKRVGYKMGAWRDVGYWQIAFDSGDDAPGELRSVADAVALAEP